MPYYRAAGEKMWEAKDGSFQDSTAAAFWDWIDRSFDLSAKQAKRYMDLVEHGRARPIETNVFNSLRESERTIYPNRNHGTGKTAWHEPVKQAISSFNPKSYARDLQYKAKERELERKLALKLIDIGFKVLTPLIKNDLQQGDDASERAGMPYYRAAGEKMLEAREGSFHDTSAAAFWDWVGRSFDLTRPQAQKYMDLVDPKLQSSIAIRTNVFNSFALAVLRARDRAQRRARVRSLLRPLAFIARSLSRKSDHTSQRDQSLPR